MRRRIDKPWGHEEILAEGCYLVKKLILEDETSTHYHSIRNELLIPVSGEGVVMLDNDFIQLAPFTPIYVKKGVKHKIIPKQTPLEVIEVSDNNVDDVVRIADKHKRV
ncbi:MAG: hypothetical protein QW660_06685 [Candidatus Bathyarchaeia archaeon]